MRTLIAILMMLSLSIVGLAGGEPVAQAAGIHVRQGRAKAKKKNKAPRPAKAKNVEKKTGKSKKNGPGFEM